MGIGQGCVTFFGRHNRETYTPPWSLVLVSGDMVSQKVYMKDAGGRWTFTGI